MRVLPASKVFTLEEAVEAGWTMSALRHAVDRGRIVRVRRGVYARYATVTRLIEDEAAARAYPDLPLSHTSSARLCGIPLVGVRATRTEMTVPPTGNADIPGVHPYRARVREHEVTVVGGLLTTSPARTVLDVARHYPTLTGVVALDHVLNSKLVTADELRDVLEFCRTWPGAPRARRAVRLCDSRSESPLETLSRLTIPRLGLPVPEPQVRIFGSNGVFIGRCDFYWDEFRVVGEADGESKYDGGPAVLVAEKYRETRLEDEELEVARWSWSDVWSHPAVLAGRLRRAYARGAGRDRIGSPRSWTFDCSPRVAIL